MADSIIKMVLDQNWADLTTFVEKRTADKIKVRVEAAKKEVLDKINDSSDTKK